MDGVEYFGDASNFEIYNEKQVVKKAPKLDIKKVAGLFFLENNV